MSSVSSSSSALLHSVFIPCTQYIYGYNYTFGHAHYATYSTYDFHAASLIRHIGSSYGLKSPLFSMYHAVVGSVQEPVSPRLVSPEGR